MSNLIYSILSPFHSVMRCFQKNLLELRFYTWYKRRIQWKNPQSFYDKILWMSCNVDTSLWSWLADKYKVREYVSARCGEDLLTKFYGAFDASKDIDFDSLPNSFVVKTNNGCTSNVLVRDKSKEDWASVCKQLDKWLKFPYGDMTGQLHYSAIKPKIIVEELLKQEDNPTATLIDYKFFCFNGKPLYCFVVTDREVNTHNYNKMLYDMQWIAGPKMFVNREKQKEIPKPVCFEQMKNVASTLSKDINFVRVDLYEVNGSVKFGEMTFMPGWDCGFSETTLLQWGKQFDETKLITASEMRNIIVSGK